MICRFSLLLCLLCSLGLAGCVSHPAVHIYGKYLSDTELRSLKQRLDELNYLVDINDYDFPASITKNTLLHSLLLSDVRVIGDVEAITHAQGMPVERVLAMSAGNHWYTKDSVAVFLFPGNSSQRVGIFADDLVETFKSDECSLELSLTLNKEGSYFFSANDSEKTKNQVLTGIWRYRQYPYLELRSKGQVHSDHYFKISEHVEVDQISEIAFITLRPIQSPFVPEGCVLKFGLRE